MPGVHSLVMENSPAVLRAFREAHGLSLADLASRVGVSRQSVSQWELGQTRPGGPAVRLLAQVFGIQPEAVEGWFSTKENAGRG